MAVHQGAMVAARIPWIVWKGTAVEPEQPKENPADRELLETIKATYALALEPEQHAMIKELRFNLPTISVDERMVLIDDIENAIGQNMEEQELDF